jgi:phthalate 4,5-dioxygenase oxygenase subunit
VLTQNENDLITRTGPGTPGGDFMRRYWQPAALSEELPPRGAPIPVRLLSEDLTMFRDEFGRPGLLGIHCAHRAADLSYGRIEDGGLRCLYHGWLYDIEGNCLEQPGEPEGSNFKDKVKQLSYPCVEKAGIIFAYLGGDDPPELPAYEFLNVPDSHQHVMKYLHESNYQQGNEGNIDPQHVAFLHLHHIGRDDSTGGLSPHAQMPTIEVDETDFGLRLTNWHDTVDSDGGEKRYLLRVSNFILPNLSAFPGGIPAGEGHGINWHVPIDDTHHWKFTINFNRAHPLDMERFDADRRLEVVDGYRLRRNLGNRFLQNREEMKKDSFIGMGPSFVVHDAFATQGEGAIQDRTKEHLGYTDKAIAAARRLMLRSIAGVQEGVEPPGVVRDPKLNDFTHLGAAQGIVTPPADWRRLWEMRADPAGSK